MSKEHKHGLPSEGELTDDELEISGGAGAQAAQKTEVRSGVGQSPSDSGGDIREGIDQKTGAGDAGWG
jgi:hypothetical protein